MTNKKIISEIALGGCEAKPSTTYRIMKRLMNKAMPRKIMSGSAADLREALLRPQPFQNANPPSFIQRRLKMETREIGGCAYYILEPHEGKKDGAPFVLFLHGGAFFMEASIAHWKTIETLVLKTGAEIWFIVYPQLPKANIIASVRSTAAVYEEALKTHAPTDITLLGDSAGASLALTLCHYIKNIKNEAASLPMPKKLVLLSPGQLKVDDPAIRSAMEAIENEDVIPVKLLDAIAELMELPSDCPAYYAAVFEGDFRGFPPADVFAGTRETFYPQIKDFVQRAADQGMKITLREGEGMCHDWPILPFAPESKKALNEAASLL